MDYAAYGIHNCDLINLNDMLQNGTMLNDIMIEKPHSLRTAMTLATQIVANVSSYQFGGCTITLTHLAPFVRISKENYIKKYQSFGFDDDTVNKLTDYDLKKEIKDSVQILQYQINSFAMANNGQSPFISVNMYLGETTEYKEELAMLIEEVLKQRYEGVKDKSGVPVTIAFPKLLYVLEEDNIHEDSKYWYLTELAAKCSAKRMVPDYISEKVMKQLKLSKGETAGYGDCFPCMGCLDYKETLNISTGDTPYKKGIAKNISIGDLFEKMLSYDCSNTKHSKALNRAKHIDNKKDREKFLNNYYLLYSGSHFNNWAKNFKLQYGRKPTRLDFKSVVGVVPDRNSVMIARGADMTLLDKWGSYYELLVCDILKKNKVKFTRNKIFKCKDGKIRELDIYLEDYNLGIEVNEFATHSKVDNEPYVVNGMRCHVDDYKGYKKGPMYSKEKANAFSEFGIFLVELWEDEIISGDFKKLNTILNTQLLPISYNTFDLNKLHPCTQRTDVIDLIDKNIYKYVLDIDGTFTRIKSVLRNSNVSNWLRITTANRSILVTTDHPLIIDNKVVYACNLSVGDYIIDSDGNKDFITSVKKVDRTDYSYDIETESHTFIFSGIQSHNCRSFLGPDVTGNGWNNKAKAKDWTPTPKYYGRFNIGVVTLNLPDVALSAKKESKKTGESLLDVFWRLMDERTELCRSVNVTRAERLEHQKASIAPILWCNGAIARLSPDEELGVLIHDGYSTASLGYCGLQEAVKVLTGGYSQFDNKEGHDLGIAIMQFMNNKCNIWNKDENIGWSIYGTPLESSTYKFAKCLKKRFGEIKDITDKDYVTNSYHHWVKDEVNAFDKLSDEAEFIALSQGGAVSYVESGNLENNIPAVLEIIKHIYNTILYAELNFASDHCQKCGFDGEILLKKSDAGTYYYQCPNCGNTDTNTLHVARRVCGYISTTIPNQGRLDDIANRFRHLDDIEAKEKE